MDAINREEIRKLVREVLAESNGRDRTPSRAPASRGPRALIVFQAGVRRLEEALKQLPLLEAQAGWSGVYTVPAVRSRVCGADVREQGGAPCILDTVKPEGLEKVLARADVLVLPTLCLLVASKVAHLMCDEPDSRLVFSALLQGKPVLAARDGFMVCEVLANEALKTEMERLINKLEGFGVVFCPTQQLAEAFRRLTSDFIPENGITQVRRSTHGGTTRLLPSRSASAPICLFIRLPLPRISSSGGHVFPFCGGRAGY